VGGEFPLARLGAGFAWRRPGPAAFVVICYGYASAFFSPYRPTWADKTESVLSLAKTLYKVILFSAAAKFFKKVPLGGAKAEAFCKQRWLRIPHPPKVCLGARASPLGRLRFLRSEPAFSPKWK